jgi:hypothetical protein
MDDRDGKFDSRRDEIYDYDDGKETSDENQYDKKSKGFFFRRK